jgi:uncharacterized membrane protein
MESRDNARAVTRSTYRTNPKYALFTVLGAMTLFVIWHNERFFLNPQAPDWAHYDPIRWHLLPHGLGGTLALALGALQFSTRLRRNHLRLHRLSGKLYIGSTFIAAPVAIWMAFISSPWFLIPFTIVQASTWVLFTVVAYLCVRRGDIRSHREWMMRSYAIVLIFLEGRVLMAIPALGRHGMDAVVLVNWGCLAVTLVVMECVLRWRDIFPAAHPNKALHRSSSAGEDEVHQRPSNIGGRLPRPVSPS